MNYENKITTPPLQLVLYFTTLLVLLTTSVIGQTTYQLNGRTLLKLNNLFYDITTNDSTRVGSQDFSVEFKPNLAVTGKIALLNINGIEIIKEWSANKCHYQISPNLDFISTINSILSMNEVEKVNFSYLVKRKTSATRSTTSTTQGNQNTTSNLLMYPQDEHFSNVWELVRTHVAMDVENLYPQDLDPEIVAWNYTVGDPSLRVAVIDDGLVWNDMDFAPNNNLGYNFFNNSPDVTPIPTDQYPNFGTAIASIIAARTSNNHNMYGVAGGYYSAGYNSPPVALVVYKAMQRYNIGGNFITYYSTNAVASSIYDAITKGVRIINIGIWDDMEYSNINDALTAAHAAGILVFAPAGNSYSSNWVVQWPANRNDVIAVCGTTSEDYLAHYCTGCYQPKGEQMELALPGEFVEIVDIFQSWGASSGIWSWPLIPTALASGIAALVISANPCLSSDEVIEILHKSCEKIGDPAGYDANGHSISFGYGLLNAETAVETALGKDAYTVSGNETWTSNRAYRGDITIPPTCSLTLNGITLKMGPDAGIIVQQGGRLETNNSVLTAICDSTWKGITVQGYPNLPQYPYTNQGQAFLYNSTVEYARIALHSPDGGRINSTNSQYLNNTLSVLCNAYSYQNNSNFNTCTFKNNLLHREPLNVRAMVKLLQNTGATFTQCQFLNELTAATPSGFGIYSAFSDFTVNGGCHTTQTPCSDEQSIPSVFDRFSYGIYAMLSPGGFKVEHGLFTNNNCGIYASNSQNVKIWKSSFQIPSDQDPDPRGAYINSCSGFHIEGNTFNCTAATHADEAGLYLLNTGPTQNYVYNNTFTNLFRGSVADGENRHATLATGLCYKCNDFSNNAYDIDIIRDDELELTSNHGINLYQGLPSAGNPSSNKDTLAASNTFSLSPYQYNIHNINNPSNYYYQEDKYPYYIKIIPDPVLGIFTFCNYGTTYNKSLVCKSWINSGGSIGQDLAAKSMANSNAGAADLLVQNTVDGGNTTNLTFDILGSMPSEALELRNQLVDESPYLSDTVLKTAIEKDNVLPNAMVRDILIENPQAAKSGEIMDMLDERYEPMPAYMKEEIEAGKQIVGGREQLEAKRDGWLQQESFLTNRIISFYLSDTVNPNAINELKAFLQNENTVQSGFALADICLQRGDYIGAAQAINTIQTNFTLSAVESQQATDYLALNTILAGLQADTIALSEVDSVHAIPLFTLYQSGDNNATAMARDILIASGLLLYQEPITIGDNEKSAIAQLPSAKPAATTKRSSDQLSIFPNPATTYTLIEYSLPANVSHASISIYNTHGVVVWKQDVKRAKDQLIIDLSSIPSGSYRVLLQSGNQTLTSKSLSVSK